MKNRIVLTFLIALSVISAIGVTTLGCGKAVITATTTTTFPSIPTGLTAAGSLGFIQLNWNASNGPGLFGYNVYKSSDGVNYFKANNSLVTELHYNDSIPSPSGDGIYYYYKVAAVGSEESGFSSTVKSMHGTRLPAINSSGFTTQVANSPYVAEGNVVVNGGDLKIMDHTKLYVTDNCTIDIEQGDGWYKGCFLVSNGLLRVMASAQAPATFTSHRVGEPLGTNEGFSLRFYYSGVNYNPADDSGTLVQNTYIKNLKSGNSLQISNGASAKLYNLKISSDMSETGGNYLSIGGNSSAIIRNCSFIKMAPSINTDLRLTTFKMDHNIFRGGYWAIVFDGLTNPGISLGQIEYNDFDCTGKPGHAYLSNMTGGANVPIGYNYWNGGLGTPPKPTELQGGTTNIHYDFNPLLISPPANAGPTW